MSDAWHGGKGSKYRPTDINKYRENHDNIDFSSLRKKTPVTVSEVEITPVEVNPAKNHLFLDDIREVKDAHLWDNDGKRLTEFSGIPHFRWNIVRSYEEFVNYIDKWGIPDTISFDNDLTEDCMIRYCDAHLAGVPQSFEGLPHKQGIDCARYVVEKCLSENKDIPDYYIHSANHFARPVIRKILEDAKISIQKQ